MSVFCDLFSWSVFREIRLLFFYVSTELCIYISRMIKNLKLQTRDVYRPRRTYVALSDIQAICLTERLAAAIRSLVSLCVTISLLVFGGCAEKDGVSGKMDCKNWLSGTCGSDNNFLTRRLATTNRSRVSIRLVQTMSIRSGRHTQCLAQTLRPRVGRVFDSVRSYLHLVRSHVKSGGSVVPCSRLM